MEFQMPENGQLISPALTPVDREHPSPLNDQEIRRRDEAEEGLRHGVLEREASDVQHEIPGKDTVKQPEEDSAIPPSPKTPKAEGRLRSATLPSPIVSVPVLAGLPLNSRSPQPLVTGRVDIPKLSPAQIIDLTSSRDAIPIRALTPVEEVLSPTFDDDVARTVQSDLSTGSGTIQQNGAAGAAVNSSRQASTVNVDANHNHLIPDEADAKRTKSTGTLVRPLLLPRSMTAPFPNPRRHSATERNARPSRQTERPRIITSSAQPTDDEKPKLREAAPIPESYSLPLPPFSIATHLHLELAGERPSPLYIHQDDASYTPYESSKVKLERLLNFLLLPPQLERALLFGALTCLDAWLYTFTILPLRFLRAFGIVVVWSIYAILNELRNVRYYLWRPQKSKTSSSEAVVSPIESTTHRTPPDRPKLRTRSSRSSRHHQRSTPSILTNNHKADLLQGLLIIFSCILLMRFDASRIYHSIRGQSAMKLYVIYNVLEVFDRLFAALGQDILECLFSAEVLSRKSNGRSRIVRPFWMFLLALIYTVLHAMAFLYQVITLNVAVNSYSNALLTLLMSNQFVEIKGTVFKKFDKESLFQITCADIVERFQLWLMLLIIALRNIIELGGLSIPSGDFAGPASTGSASSNSTTGIPTRTFSILPNSFTIVPYSLLVPAQVLVPFLVVLGSETLVDWVKHAYISKFNATSPSVYGLFLDVLSKDYYENAFAEQNLMKRLGLPVLPLACLFIRAALQTYHMFLATNVSALPPPSLATEVAIGATSTASPVLAQIDTIFRNALGRSSFGAGGSNSHASFAASSSSSFFSISSLTHLIPSCLDDLIALATMTVFFLTVYLILLILKLILGMLLLRFSRDRYLKQKLRERRKSSSAPGVYLVDSKRIGGWGTVEIGEERRRTIFEGDEAGLKGIRDREMRFREKGDGEGKGRKEGGLDRVMRYNLGQGKRIW